MGNNLELLNCCRGLSEVRCSDVIPWWIRCPVHVGDTQVRRCPVSVVARDVVLLRSLNPEAQRTLIVCCIGFQDEYRLGLSGIRATICAPLYLELRRFQYSNMEMCSSGTMLYGRNGNSSIGRLGSMGRIESPRIIFDPQLCTSFFRSAPHSTVDAGHVLEVKVPLTGFERCAGGSVAHQEGLVMLQDQTRLECHTIFD